MRYAGLPVPPAGGFAAVPVAGCESLSSVIELCLRFCEDDREQLEEKGETALKVQHHVDAAVVRLMWGPKVIVRLQGSPRCL